MTKIPRFVENGFVVSSMLVSTGALTLWRGGDDPGLGGRATDPLLQAIWFGIYGVSLILLFALRKRAVGAVGRNKLIWLLLGVILFSTYWSTIPEITLRRGIALVGTTLFGVYLATRYSLREQLRLLAWTLGIAAILSLLVAIALPSYGHDSTGEWRGIYAQKNILGRLMVMSAMVFFIIALYSQRHRWIVWAMFGLSIGLIVLTASKTALVNLVTLLALLILYRLLRLHYNLAIPLSIFTILAIGGVANLLSSNSEILLNSMGKNATLTGRTDVWDSVWYMISKRPILGYGYGGFWTSGANGPALYIWLATGWRPTHAHNGFLNLCLDIGFLGLSVYLIGYLFITMRAVNWIRLTKTAESFWPLTYMAFIFLYNQTESSLVGQNDIFWILYTALCFSKYT